jgi:hypothetical protein
VIDLAVVLVRAAVLERIEQRLHRVVEIPPASIGRMHIHLDANPSGQRFRHHILEGDAHTSSVCPTLTADQRPRTDPSVVVIDRRRVRQLETEYGARPWGAGIVAGVCPLRVAGALRGRWPVGLRTGGLPVAAARTRRLSHARRTSVVACVVIAQRFHGGVSPFAADVVIAGCCFASYPLISFVISPVSSRFLQPTLIVSGRLWSSSESFGAITLTARQIADSSARAIFTAISLGLSRLSRAQSSRPLNSPSTIWNVSWRYSPVPALVGFFSDSVMTATYLPGAPDRSRLRVDVARVESVQMCHVQAPSVLVVVGRGGVAPANGSSPRAVGGVQPVVERHLVGRFSRFFATCAGRSVVLEHALAAADALRALAVEALVGVLVCIAVRREQHLVAPLLRRAPTRAC